MSKESVSADYPLLAGISAFTPWREGSLFRTAGKHLRIIPRISLHGTVFLPQGTLLSFRITSDELTGSACTTYKINTPTDYACGNTPMGVSYPLSRFPSAQGIKKEAARLGAPLFDFDPWNG
jgi:hypothetical protein